jgi:hypothetical protein
MLLSTLLQDILHPSHHLLNVLLQIANKLGLSNKKSINAIVLLYEWLCRKHGICCVRRFLYIYWLITILAIERVKAVLTLWNRVRIELSLKLSGTGYSDRDASWFPSIPSEKWRNSISIRPTPLPSKFFPVLHACTIIGWYRLPDYMLSNIK